MNRRKLLSEYKKEINNQEMSPANYNSSPFFQLSGWNTSKYFKEYYSDGINFPLVLIANEGEGIMYYSMTKAKVVAEDFFKKYWRDPSVLDEVVDKFDFYAKLIDEMYVQSGDDYMQQNSIDILRETIIKLRDSTWSLNTLVFFSIYFDRAMFIGLVKDLNISISNERLDELWNQAIVPVFESFDKRREVYLADLLNRGLDTEEILERCQYFQANYNRILDYKELKSEIKKDYALIFAKNKKQLKEFLDDFYNESKLKKEDFELKLNNLNKEESRIFYYVQEIMELRDVRKDYIAKTLVIAYRVSKKIFAEAALPEKLIYFCTIDEILKGKEYLKRKKNEIEKRLEGVMFLVKYDGSVGCELGDYALFKKELNTLFLSKINKGKGSSISGQVGYPGRVVAKVRVIKNIYTDNDSFVDGDILVTGMTRPEFVPLMKKASAIITDEGGITCHAAIVSREFKKPCIVGTKIATQVLKDGDMVEVDADKGVVKIMKKVNNS